MVSNGLRSRSRVFPAFSGAAQWNGASPRSLPLVAFWSQQGGLHGPSIEAGLGLDDECHRHRRRAGFRERHRGGDFLNFSYVRTIENFIKNFIMDSPAAGFG